MKHFYIDIAYVVDVIVCTEHTIKQRETETTEDFLVRKLQYDGVPMYSISNKDHDEFTKLRDQLGNGGYITIDRNCWNGDRVVKPFYLNNVKFSKGYKFSCAAAMKWTLEHNDASI